MTQLIADRRDIDFVLYEQLHAEDILGHPRYKGFNRKSLDMILAETRRLSLKELLPTNADGDREGVRFENGQVKTPDGYRRGLEVICEAELVSLTEDPQWGGQGLPFLINQAVGEYLAGANYALTMYSHSGHGTGKMIELYGSEMLKELFLKKLYTSEWCGTMVLTEPEAGSDLGALTATAVKNPDGTYRITGNKIFITVGEHDLHPNIVHPVLARVEGAPAGTKGISIFVVPKFWVNPDGSLGDPNDVVCTGVEEKMGIHGSATCSMSFGSSGTCRGWLLGEENQGLKIMFHMMNEARLNIGMQGQCTASAAYLYALDYARQRLQGKALAAQGDPASPSVPIIQHPDVRRMLAWMKAHVEGMRSLVYYVAAGLEETEHGADEAQRVRAKGMVDLLTPVVKAYCAQRGFEVCVQAMQVHGGCGYTSEYPVEQLARDVKIASIYEGTDGIQAMDLLGRKLGMQKGGVFKGLLGEIMTTVAQASEHAELVNQAAALAKSVKELGDLARHLGLAARSPQFEAAFAHAAPFLEVTGDVTMAWMLLWRAHLAAKALNQSPSKKDRIYYQGLLGSARFFIETVLPVTAGKMQSISAMSAAAVELEDASFGR